MEKRTAVAVFDLDGVLADTRHRMHFLERRRDWKGFFAAAVDDPPHPEGLAAARTAASSGLDLVYLSGRPEQCRIDTEQWLREHQAPAGRLLLRPDGDRRPAERLKVAQLRRLADRHHVRLLVDDDPRVVAAVRATRPPLAEAVLHADWQPYTATMASAQHAAGRT